MSATLYRHGVVHSAADPFAEAVLVADGVVAWLGPDDAAHRFAGDADVVDLDGALVTPAFVDAHAHVALTGLAQGGPDLEGRRGVAVLEAVAAASGPVVLGTGWGPDGAAPDPSALSAAAGGRPVLLLAADLTRAAASIDLVSGDEPGGAMVAGDDLVRALGRLMAAVPDATTRGLTAAAAAGIVAVHEHSLPSLEPRSALAALIAATSDDASGLPLVVGYRAELCETTDDARQILAEIPGLTGIAGDLAVDGRLMAWAAALRSPYADAPELRGELRLHAEQVANHIASTTRAHTQGGFRVHGDRALEEVLVGIRAAADVEGSAALHAAGHRLDGLELVDAPALALLVLLGVRAAVQPAAVARMHATAQARLGPLRVGGVLPLADLAGAGVPLGLGSGSPSSGFDPWAAVRAALLHAEPEQRVSARAAFRAHTRGGWRLAGLDGTGAGEIRVGAPAHLAVWRAEQLVVQAPEGRLAAWSTDPRAGTPLLPDLGPDAPEPVCVRTLRAGNVIHDTLG